MSSITALLKQAGFISSASNYASLPTKGGIEVAFAGRSNAGKSSVLNTLVNRKALARTSSSPGKTRHINLFALDPKGDVRLADLPGYGYAKVSAKEQERWGMELTQYITQRQGLQGVVIVMDIRHPLTEKDKQMVVLCRTGNRRVHVLLNKSDKLKSSQEAKILREVKQELAFSAPGADCSIFSALKGRGLAELRQVLEAWLLPGDGN